jgi:hypothetical protein
MITSISASVSGAPRSRMFFRLSAHSPRDSRERVTWPSSWQIWHFCVVSVEPGPEVSFCGSCAWATETPPRPRAPRRRGHATTSTPTRCTPFQK